jgi:outer membrane protein
MVLSLSASATDLLDAYHLAQDSDPTFQSARYALEAVQQKIPQARAALLPALNATGSKDSTHANTEFTGVPQVDRNMHSWAWNLQLTQPLIRASNLYAVWESESQVDQALAQYDQAQQDLMLRVAQAYFGVIVAQDVITAADAEVQALQEQLAQVKRGFDAGTHAITDIDDTQARLSLAQSQRVAAQNDLESKRADLEKVTGQALTNLAVLQPAATTAPPQPLDVQAWIREARTDNPAVRVQQAALAAAQTDIKKNRADYAPTLDFVASRGSNYASNSLTTPNDYSTRVTSTQVGVQLNIPLYGGGITNAKVAEAIANRNKAQADLEAASRQAATDAQQAYAGVINGVTQVEALNTALASARSALKGNQVGYQLGLKINVDVLNAQQQLYTTQRDWTKARYDTLMQGLKLKAATGTLTQADLQGINAMLAMPASIQTNAADWKRAELPTQSTLADTSNTPTIKSSPSSNGLSHDTEHHAANDQEVVMETIHAWAQSWINQDVDQYLRFYSRDFTPAEGRSRQQWEAQRRSRITSSQAIHITIDAPSVVIKGNQAIATFRQRYQSDRITNTSEKTLALVKQDGQWKIRAEQVNGQGNFSK